MVGTKRASTTLAIGLAMLALAWTPDAADAQLTLDWYTVDGGGGTWSMSGSLSLGGTVGQPDAGSLSGDGLLLMGGFWLGGGVVSSTPEPPVDPAEPGEALAFRLVAGYPNPFSDATHVALELAETTPVRVRVFDPSGRIVRELCDRMMPAGRHLFTWKGSDDSGRRAASGVYLLQVQAGAHEVRKRVILLR